MSRRMLRNIAIVIAVGLVVGAVLGAFFDNSDASNIIIGAVAGASAVVLIGVIDRMRDDGRSNRSG